MDAARIKRVRRRIRGYFFGSGIVLAILYLIAAAFLIKIFGVELTHYWSTILLAAGVMLGGSYAIIMILWICIHVARRIKNRQPIWDRED